MGVKEETRLDATGEASKGCGLAWEGFPRMGRQMG